MNRYMLFPVSIAAVITTLVFIFPRKNGTPDQLLRILEETHAQCKSDKLLYDSSSLSSFSEFIDSTSQKLSESLGKRTKTPDAVDSIISLIYNTWQIVFNDDDFDLNAMFPQTVITSKKGSCLGVSLLFLIIAEKIGCPLYGVILPGHIYIRYDDGVQCRNIEPNKQGISHPDSYYRERYLQSQSRNKTLNKASVADLVAILNFNIANSSIKQNRPDCATKYYKKSIAFQPQFAEAWGNLALHYDSQGKTSEARKAFDKAHSIQPDLYYLAINQGSFELNHGNLEGAILAITTGLKYYPDDKRLKELFEAAGKLRYEKYN